MPLLASQKDAEEDRLPDESKRTRSRSGAGQKHLARLRSRTWEPVWFKSLCFHFRGLVRRWYTLVLLLIVAMCLHADQNLAAPNLSAIADEFDLTPLEKDSKLGGQVQLGFFFVGGATSLALGPLADRLNRVNLLLAVVILGSVPCALIKYIPSGGSGFLWYFLCRVLTGVSVGGSFPLLYSLCGDLAAPEQRGIVSAAMGVATSVGVASGQLLSGFLGPRWGWRIPFVVVAYPAIFFACLLWFTVSDPRSPSEASRTRHEEGIELMSPKGSASSSTEKYNGEDPSVAPGVSEAYERNPSHSVEKSQVDIAARTDLPDPSAQAMDGHAAITDCKRFGLVWRGRSNRLFLIQAVPGCIAWSTVTTFIPDYLHKEQGLSVESATLLVSFFGASCLLWALLGAALGQRIYHRNKGHLAYLMASCTSFAVGPFLLMINSNPDALMAQMVDNAQGSALPSLWALSLAFLGGAAAVTNPNLKGLLMNVNSSATRGTVFALVTLTDDVGKGLGPEVVAIVVSAMGRRWALSAAVSCWLLSSLLLYLSRWTLVNDVLRVERLEKLPEAAV